MGHFGSRNLHAAPLQRTPVSVLSAMASVAAGAAPQVASPETPWVRQLDVAVRRADEAFEVLAAARGDEDRARARALLKPVLGK